MKKLLLILALVFTLSSNACIGSLGLSDFHAEGVFQKSGHSWLIATMGDGKIHYYVTDADGKTLVDNIMSHSDAIYYANNFHAQGHGGDGC